MPLCLCVCVSVVVRVDVCFFNECCSVYYFLCLSLCFFCMSGLHFLDA